MGTGDPLGMILDLDGTLYHGGEPIPGAAAAVRRLRDAGISLRFATNTTRRPRRALVERLASMGIPVSPAELHTAPVAAARWLEERKLRRLMLLLPAATWEEFDRFTVDEERPDVVLVGDLGEAWTWERLNTAFRTILGGARLVAIQKNRSWDAGNGPQLDAGPFVAALEYATGTGAVVVGKPSPAFFETAAASLGLPRDRVVVVGDSVDNDVAGARNAGFRAVAVRTGSFREERLRASGAVPEVVLDSVADLPAWLGIR